MQALAGLTIVFLLGSIVDAFVSNVGIFSLLFIAPLIPSAALCGLFLKDNTPESRKKLSTAFCLNALACIIAFVVHAVKFLKSAQDVYDYDEILPEDELATLEDQQEKLVETRRIVIPLIYLGFSLLFIANLMWSCAAIRYVKLAQ